MTTVSADILYDQLTAAIRAEVLTEVIEHLQAWHATLERDNEYFDGAEDAIITVRELQS